MRFSTSCWLLAALTTTTALAQTHPKKSSARNTTLKTKAVAPQPESWTKDYREPYPYLPEDFPQVPELEPRPSSPDEAYTYVEQMPLLNGQPIGPATIAAISHAVVVPAGAPEGRIFVQFVVTKEGKVSQPQIAKGLRADVDSAVVAVARTLPAFTPGKHSGQAVPVRVMLPVTIVEQRP